MSKYIYKDTEAKSLGALIYKKYGTDPRASIALELIEDPSQRIQAYRGALLYAPLHSVARADYQLRLARALYLWHPTSNSAGDYARAVAHAHAKGVNDLTEEHVDAQITKMLQMSRDSTFAIAVLEGATLGAKKGTVKHAEYRLQWKECVHRYRQSETSAANLAGALVSAHRKAPSAIPEEIMHLRLKILAADPSNPDWRRPVLKSAFKAMPLFSAQRFQYFAAYLSTFVKKKTTLFSEHGAEMNAVGKEQATELLSPKILEQIQTLNATRPADTANHLGI